MDWFLYDNDLHHERVKADLSKQNGTTVVAAAMILEVVNN